MLRHQPLYYHDDGRRLVFASELKALMLDLWVRATSTRGARRTIELPLLPSPEHLRA